MKRQGIMRLLFFMVLTLWGVSSSIDAQTRATLSTEDYKDARQVAQKYVKAALLKDYKTLKQNQYQAISEEIEEKGGYDCAFGEDFHKLHEMRQAYHMGYRPIEATSVAFVMDTDDDYWMECGAPKGTIIVRFYFTMLKENKKPDDLDYNDLKLEMIKVNGKWLIMRVK